VVGLRTGRRTEVTEEYQTQLTYPFSGHDQFVDRERTVVKRINIINVLFPSRIEDGTEDRGRNGVNLCITVTVRIRQV
jgi:hypothetical protein